MKNFKQFKNISISKVFTDVIFVDDIVFTSKRLINWMLSSTTWRESRLLALLI